MKKYRVNVNGTVFEVEIEEMTGAPAAPAVAAAAPAAPAAPAGGEKITAPMPGTILAVNVANGSAAGSVTVTRAPAATSRPAMSREASSEARGPRTLCMASDTF